MGRSFFDFTALWIPAFAGKLYGYNGDVLGYGMKFWPYDYEALKSKIPQIGDLEDLLV